MGTFTPSAPDAAGAFSGKGNKNNINAIFSNPVVMQAMFMLASAGKNPWDEIGQFYTNKKGAKGAPAGQFLKLGGNQYLDIGALSAKLPDYAQGQENANLEAQGKTYEKLKNTPQFANIFNEAQGNFSQSFDAETAKAFGNLGSYALGKGVSSGFLDDPAKQAAILAPVGVQLAQYKQQVKKNAEMQALGYSGAGYLGGSNPAGLLGGGTAGSYMGNLFSAGALFQNNQQFNAGQDFAQNAASAAFYQDQLGNAQSAASYGAYGGA